MKDKTLIMKWIKLNFQYKIILPSSRLTSVARFCDFFAGDKQEKFGFCPSRSNFTSATLADSSDKQLHAHAFDVQTQETEFKHQFHQCINYYIQNKIFIY